MAAAAADSSRAATREESGVPAGAPSPAAAELASSPARLASCQQSQQSGFRQAAAAAADSSAQQPPQQQQRQQKRRQSLPASRAVPLALGAPSQDPPPPYGSRGGRRRISGLDDLLRDGRPLAKRAAAELGRSTTSASFEARASQRQAPATTRMSYVAQQQPMQPQAMALCAPAIAGVYASSAGKCDSAAAAAEEEEEEDRRQQAVEVISVTALVMAFLYVARAVRSRALFSGVV